MSLTLSPVTPSDAALLIRTVEHPAMHDNPLQQIIFPHPSTPEETETELQWRIQDLHSTIQKNSETLMKISESPDGHPWGFAGWTL